MTEYICNFCNNKFSKKIILDKHKTTAKYCLELQKKNISNDFKEISVYKCNFCNKEYLRKDNLNLHLLTRKNKTKYETKNKEEEYSNIINEQKLKINDLENKNKKNKTKYELIDKSNKEYSNIINEQKLKIDGERQLQKDEVLERANKIVILPKRKANDRFRPKEDKRKNTFACSDENANFEDYINYDD